jgi:hypothetical protein
MTTTNTPKEAQIQDFTDRLAVQVAHRNAILKEVQQMTVTLPPAATVEEMDAAIQQMQDQINVMITLRNELASVNRKIEDFTAHLEYLKQ